MAIVYRHIRPDKNEVFYIGIGSNIKRAFQFNRGRNCHWKHIFEFCQKQVEVEILFEDLTWEEACKKEMELISFYGRRDLNKGSLVNLTDGGDGSCGIKQSEESKLKRASKRVGIPLANEHKQKIRESKLGCKNPWFGKNFTEEHKKKLINKLTGRVCSEDTRRKIAVAQGKKIINKKTKEIFLTIKDAADSINMKVKTLNAKLTGQNKNNTNLEYLKY